MSHFDPGRQMQLLKEKFIAQSLAVSQVPPDTADRIWELMAAFAGYGFPKAHAASYAQVSWRSAWCKTHFPAEFMAAVLANWGGYYSQRVYLAEARRMGLTIRPPHVNHSQREFCVVYPQGEPALFMGLDQVRDLTRRTQERILACQPFKTLDDFLQRVDPRRQEAENLARVGAFAGLGVIPVILKRLESGDWRAGQLSLFPWDGSIGEDWSLNEQVAAQETILGISVSAHPLELFASQIAGAGAITTVEAASKVGEKICVAGMRQSSHRGRTGKGDLMLFLTLEDLEGTLDAVVFPDTYRRSYQALASSGPFLFTGTVEMDAGRGEPLLRAEKIEKLVLPTSHFPMI
jgi:error-prone DNA polymerase